MAKINILDKKTIDQIAAGEVIERPASVVKELVENAIDAKADAITVEIKEGGTKLIRITDNGEGIEADQVAVAFQSHTTSKIRTAEDLLTVGSLGFRGEALSSIAAVSMVELITRTPDELTGTRYCIEGGEEKCLEEIGAPEGTTFLVRDLFYNVPARRKFLKKPQTEGGYIGELLNRIALSHPEVSIKLILNGQVKLHTSGNGNLKDVIYTIFGRDMTRCVLPVQYEADGMEVTGFIGKPEIGRSNRNYEIFFVNGRSIKSVIFSKALEDAFGGLLMQHRYPFAVLQVKIPGELLDVNVHPTKQEIRFSNQEQMYQLLYHAGKNGLEHQEFIPRVKPGKEEEKSPIVKPVKKDSKGYEPFETQGKRAAEEKTEKPAFLNSAQKPTERVSENVVPAREHSAFEAFLRSSKPRSSTSYFNKEEILSRNIKEKNEEKTAEEAAAIPEVSYKKEQSLQSSHIIAQNQVPTVDDFDDEEEDLTDGKISGSIAKTEDIYIKETRTEENCIEGSQIEESQIEESQTEEEDVFPPFVDPTIGKQEKREKKDVSEPLTGDEMEDDAFGEAGSVPESERRQMNLFSDHFLEEKKADRYRVIGQLFSTYWLIEYEDNFYMMDQHAAHEKVNYERMMKQLKDSVVISQMVSPPIICSLNLAEEQLLLEHMQEFERCGFVVEHFGGHEYALSGVPDILSSVAKDSLFLELLDSIGTDGKKMVSEMVLDRIATMACKASVKGGQKLSEHEILVLLQEMMGLENPYHCPHGRPTMICMTKAEIEKKFKRIV